MQPRFGPAPDLACVERRRPCRLTTHDRCPREEEPARTSAPTQTRMPDSFMFSKMDADRILKRAGEIEGSEDARPLTVDELRSIAREAGFGSKAVERAIAEARQAASTEEPYHPVQKSGLVITDLSTTRAISIEVSSEQLMRAVRLFQPYREGPAQIKLEEHQITWRDRKGLRFTVTSGGGVTEIRVFVSRLLIRRGRWMGWVRNAADRLETLVFLVATRDVPRTQQLEAHGAASRAPILGPGG